MVPMPATSSAAEAASAAIAFLGGGNMARAIIAGLLRQGRTAASLRVGEPRAQLRSQLERDYGVVALADNAAVLAGAALVVLAVKPQDAAQALRSASAHWPGPATALLSIVAGVRIEALAGLCPPGTAIVRAMPNRPALRSAGVTGLYAPPSVPAAARALAEALAGAVGQAVWVRSEDELDVVTAVSGSGPAYFLLLAEQLARAAQASGLSPETARLLATETLYGSGVLAHGHERPASALQEERAAVTSPGGTTEAALRVLQAGGLEQLVAHAVQAATARSRELAALFAASERAR
jgi:pyrroline-5-carboxylate reductase